MARNYRNLENHNGSGNLTLDRLEHDFGRPWFEKFDMILERFFQELQDIMLICPN